jgi:hypothetical protein
MPPQASQADASIERRERSRLVAAGRVERAARGRDHPELGEIVEPSLGRERLGRRDMSLGCGEVAVFEVDATEHRERADLDEPRSSERAGERVCGRLEIAAPPGRPAERPGRERPPRTVPLVAPGPSCESHRLADVVPGQRRPREDAGTNDCRSEADRPRRARKIEPALALRATAIQPQQPAAREGESHVVA